jgi:hypothetical protein
MTWGLSKQRDKYTSFIYKILSLIRFEEGNVGIW